MGCCGKARTNLSASPGPSIPALRPHRGLLQPPSKPVMLRYVGQSGFTVRGPGTGRHYTFSSGLPVQSVDPRDAAVFLRTNYFRVA